MNANHTTRHPIRTSLILGICLVSAACGWLHNGSQTATVTGSLQNYEYLIAPGDTLNVFVWQNPDVSVQNVPVRPDGMPTVTGAGIPTLSDQVYVQRRLSGGVVLEAGRNDFDILVFQEERDFQFSGAREDFWGASVLWTRNISRLTYLDMSAGWTSVDTNAVGTNTDLTDERQDDLLSLHLGLRRELGRHLTSTIEYRRVERSSTDPTADLVENRISAGIRLAF
ncbi:MAG: hypothetical protein M3461_16245 [Pseudomonadota bacterium]|nr:hypothetical protein [Pseudomonadota bacterium]